jgi:hypothetical protein
MRPIYTDTIKGLESIISTGFAELKEELATMNIHLAQLNGTVAHLKSASDTHEATLTQQADVIAKHSTVLAVMEAINAKTSKESFWTRTRVFELFLSAVGSAVAIAIAYFN